jgi:vancomycin resistance protein YoaR
VTSSSTDASDTPSGEGTHSDDSAAGKAPADSGSGADMPATGDRTPEAGTGDEAGAPAGTPHNGAPADGPTDQHQPQAAEQPAATGSQAPGNSSPAAQPEQASGAYDGTAPTTELPAVDSAPETVPDAGTPAPGTPPASPAGAPPSAPSSGGDPQPGADSEGADAAASRGTEPPDTEAEEAAALPNHGASPADASRDRPSAYRFDPDRPSPYRDDAPQPRHLKDRRQQGDSSTQEADGGSDAEPTAGPWASLRQRLHPQLQRLQPRLQRFQGRTALLVASLAVPMVLALVIVAWAVDYATSSGEVQRNVRVAGEPIGGIAEDGLPAVIGDIGADVAARDVQIEVDGEVHEAQASDLGLTLDEQTVASEAMDAGRGGTLVARPFRWAWSFVSPHDVPLHYQVSETDTAAVLQLLLGEERTTPVDPRVELFEGHFVVVPGQPGQDLDSAQVAADVLAEAGESSDPGSPIEVSAPLIHVEPRFTNEEAQELADRANQITADGLTVQADGSEQVVSTEQLRSWLSVTETDEGALDLVFDTEAATHAVSEMFSDLDSEPRNATVVLQGGEPVVQPGENGVTCCGDDSGERIWESLESGDETLELEVETVEPEYTTEEVEGWGIEEPIGGSRAWQSGSGDVSGPGPGFTTYYTAGQNRAHNIQLMADQVHGAVIPPGGRFSINEHIGPRTEAGGYRADGAIRDREMVQEVGGGVSQFSTTMFNAAFFAGLDIPQYQAHSEYFDRYPPGREATMGHPAPDLVIENSTPYGVLITTSHTPTSVTVTFWSTEHASSEQSGIDESRSGDCRYVTVTRTRTYPDGSSENDSFRAAYASEEGVYC